MTAVRRVVRGVTSTAVGLALAATVTPPGGALPARASAEPPTGFVESIYAADLPTDDLTGLKFAPDGRLFVIARTGEVWIIRDGSRLEDPFVTLDVDHSAVEAGLVGIAFDPEFEENGYVYLNYTARTPSPHQRISRFRAVGDRAGPERILLDLEPIHEPRHVGGAMVFGADGMLYVGVGESGLEDNSQSLDSGYGKILRIRPDGSIPADNPFVREATGAGRATWALGLRNPFSMAVSSRTGRLFVNDAGFRTFEEINEALPGENYGWPEEEGYSLDRRYRTPLHAYRHSVGCAIDAGTFYEPDVATFPSRYVGGYFFLDLCGGWIHVLDPETNSVSEFASGLGPEDTVTALVGLEVGPDGALYWINRWSQAVFRLQYTGSLAPVIALQPVDRSAQAGSPVTFAIRASGDALLYQWQRDGVDIRGAISSSYTIPAVTGADNGARLRCIIRSPLGEQISLPGTLTVLPPRAAYDVRPPPVWSPGETRTYSVRVTNTGSDAWNTRGFYPVRLGVQFGTESEIPLDGWLTDQRFELPSAVDPGESVTVRVTVTAPLTQGSFFLHHRMVKEDITWFDEVDRTPVTLIRETRWYVLLPLVAVAGALVLVGGWFGYYAVSGGTPPILARLGRWRGRGD